MTTSQIFPTILIVLDIGDAVVWAWDGNLRMAIYWCAAAVLTVCVSY